MLFVKMLFCHCANAQVAQSLCCSNFVKFEGCFETVYHNSSYDDMFYFSESYVIIIEHLYPYKSVMVFLDNFNFTTELILLFKFTLI